MPDSAQKLKCCLNYEVDCYVEAQKRLPSKEIELETKDGTFYFFKADILSNHVSYSTDKNFPANLVTISGKRAFEVIAMNKKGMKPDSLLEAEVKQESKSRLTCWNRKASPVSTVTEIIRTETTVTGTRRREKEIMTTARRHRPKVEIVRSNLRGGENENRPQPSENGNRGERGDRENRPRNNNNNNRNRGQNQGRNNENRRPERGQNQERPQNPNRPQNQERPQNRERQPKQERPQNQERPQEQGRQPNQERIPRPERNSNQEKPQNNEKPAQE